MSAMQLPSFRRHWALIFFIPSLLFVCLWRGGGFRTGPTYVAPSAPFQQVDIYFQKNPMAGNGLHRSVAVKLPKTATPEDVVKTAVQSLFTKYEILGIRSVPTESKAVTLSDEDGTIQFGTTAPPNHYEALIFSDRGEKLISYTFDKDAKSWIATLYDISNFPPVWEFFGDSESSNQREMKFREEQGRSQVKLENERRALEVRGAAFLCRCRSGSTAGCWI